MRNIERIPPLVSRLGRLWLERPHLTLQELINEAGPYKDDLDLVQRLEKKFDV